jgi:HK97 family phage major capsid protein
MNRFEQQLNDARRAASAKSREMRSLTTQALDPELTASQKREIDRQIAALNPELERLEELRDRQEALAEARSMLPPSEAEKNGYRGDGAGAWGGPWGATPRGLFSENVYRPDVAETSYIRDLVATALPGRHSPDQVAAAAERLGRNEAEARESLGGYQYRDVSTADPGAGSFVPPIYLADAWIGTARPGRPLADAVAKIPYPPEGKTVSVPRVQTGPEADVQAAEANAVNEVDFDSQTLTVNKITIAGQNDISLQALEFTQPGLDSVIVKELVRSYDSRLDAQILYGTGINGQHRGLKTVVASDGGNAISFSSGNAAALLGKVYESTSDIATLAPGFVPDAIVMSPRRAAWIASHRDVDTPLLQQGQLMLASGTQAGGEAGTIAGLSVILDGNIETNQGSGTNEDDLFVLATSEVMLAEGPLRTRVLTEVLSSTLQIRMQCFAFSALLSSRRPKVIARISGAGLSSPVFPSGA